VFRGKVLNDKGTLRDAGIVEDVVVLFVPPAEVDLSSFAPETLKTLTSICKKVIEHPSDDKYRTLKKANATFKKKVLDAHAQRVLERAGFRETDEAFVLAPSASAWKPLNDVKAQLERELQRRLPTSGLLPTSPGPGFPGGLLPGGLSGTQGLVPGLSQVPDVREVLDLIAANPALARQSGVDPAQMRQMAAMLQSNPDLRRHVDATVRRLLQNPALASQFLQNPALASQFAPTQPTTTAQPPQQQNPGGSASSSGSTSSSSGTTSSGNADMSEEEAILEAIRRSLREQ